MAGKIGAITYFVAQRAVSVQRSNLGHGKRLGAA